MTDSARIFFNDEPIPARPDDTVASALFRHGRRIFGRSFKYHRPRGLLCAAGRCPNCLVNVDGVPNVRACTTPVRDGMKVAHQNAWPSLDFDLMASTQLLGWAMPVGFYYKTFTRRWMWKLAEPLIRRVAGLGVIQGTPADAPPSYEHLHQRADVAVVGGGPAGLAAAAAAAGAGAQVVLIDDQTKLGGHLRFLRRIDEEISDLIDSKEAIKGGRGNEVAGRLEAAVREFPNVKVLNQATAFGLYEGRLLGILQDRRLIHLRAGKLIVATGTYEVPLVFENNDLPGVMLSSAVQRLINVHELKLGDAAAVVSHEEDGGAVAEDLRASGVRIAAVVPPSDVRRVKGRRRVRSLLTRRAEIACDLVVVRGPRVPDAALLSQAGAKLVWDDEAGAFLPASLPDFAAAAGRVTGDTSLRGALIRGRCAGLEAAGAPRGPADDEPFREPLRSPAPLHHPLSREGKAFVCYCEDQTVRDLEDAMVEGFEEIETLKRYTTATMGPCQGKMCQLPSIGICARRKDVAPGAVGTTTSRPPVAPVPLGALAGPHLHHPVKRTPMHELHERFGCVWTDMGEWKRPLYYTKDKNAPMRACVEAEYRAVRERAGMIDLSTLGKLDVAGTDAPKLLDKVYTNRFSDLKVGRARYAVICDEAGVILDDGTISRAAPDRYFITTTTGNIEFVQQWLEWWAAGTGMCVHVTNVTGGFAAVNVAGPKARDLLRKVTKVDLGPKAFPYMGCTEGEVAGVPCFLMRLGFVGETGWEVHFPAEYGEYLWDTFLEAGREFDVWPFGVEAQRLLRLEKRHVIVGVDTDATSTPIGADLAWVAKMDKDDFIGKAGIARARGRPARERLVGFVLQDESIPEDGSAIARDGKPVGRITSVRFSPAHGKAVGLAWVPADMADPGREIDIHLSGRFARAKIVADPFYDPKGERQKR
ncbi:MAG: (2Fe-2S)-binding protein [Planctomycetes bacterium]|nr:(2Fe-2S)-binding protein [Planctomycetota bacterium]